MIRQFIYQWKLFRRFGFKVKRYRAAWDRVWQTEDVRNWRRLYRLRKGLPPFKRSDKYEEFYDPFFVKKVISVMVFDKFSELKPFPKNAGATTIRFSKRISADGTGKGP